MPVAPGSVPVITSDAHLQHAGLLELAAGRDVPCFESPERVVRIRAALETAGGYVIQAPADHGVDPITAVHDLELVDLLEHVWTDARDARRTDGVHPIFPDTFRLVSYASEMGVETMPGTRPERLGAFCFDTATPIVAGTYAAARDAVDVALTALDRVVEGAPLAYGLCRPPGHHAGRRLFGGYCYFNNAAIVAERLAGLGASRVAVLDLDYHHGNGTQQIFWERPDVLYVSLHGDPRAAYPYFSGAADETGGGRGAGTTSNLPLPAGTDGGAYRTALADALEIVAGFSPDAPLVVSLGFDTHREDPICDFALETEDLASIGAAVAALGRSVVVLQEGGYALEVIGANAVAFLDGLRNGATTPE